MITYFPDSLVSRFCLAFCHLQRVPGNQATAQGGANKAKSHLSTVLCSNHICPPGWLSVFSACWQTCKPTPASFVHTNSQASHSTESPSSVCLFICLFICLFTYLFINLLHFFETNCTSRRKEVWFEIIKLTHHTQCSQWDWCCADTVA